MIKDEHKIYGKKENEKNNIIHNDVYSIDNSYTKVKYESAC